MKQTTNNIACHYSITAFVLCLLLLASYKLLPYASTMVFHNGERSDVALMVSCLFFFIYDMSSFAIFFKMIVDNRKRIAMYYLAHKSIRILISLGIVVIYVLFKGVGTKAFALEFFLLYVVTLIFESVLFYLWESKMKRKQ